MNSTSVKRNNNAKYSAKRISKREVYNMNYLEIENVIGREIIDSAETLPLKLKYGSQTAPSRAARLPAALPQASLRRWNFATATSPDSAARAFPGL